MSDRFRYRFIITGIVIIMICSGLYIYSRYNPGRVSENGKPSRMRIYAHAVQQQGIMSSQDMLQLNTISIGVEKTRRISDQDLSWALRLFQSQPVVDTPENRMRLHAQVMAYILEVKYYSPSQKRLLFTVALPLLTSSEAHDRKLGVRVMDDLQDVKAVPYLQPLLKDPDANVRTSAAKLVNKLNRLHVVTNGLAL